MTEQRERAAIFADLHIKGNPLVLFNIWDAGSAQAVQDAGAKAIATGSLSVAEAHGFQDGEHLPFVLALANLKRIIAQVELPVTIDLEGGYGVNPEALREPVARVIEAGAIGINFEDQIVGEQGLYAIRAQCVRIEAIRRVAEETAVPLFINARTDIFLKLNSNEHRDKHVQEAINRASAYAEAGADGFFVPGLQTPSFIEKLCERVSLPVNILQTPNGLMAEQLAQLGVARISHGPYPYFQAMGLLKTIANNAFTL